uniref:Uncharacterized protein n=1 Tax=Arundo donax TaxID=35708 RepID=A0A0A8XSC9_ARUDO
MLLCIVRIFACSSAATAHFSVYLYIGNYCYAMNPHIASEI